MRDWHIHLKQLLIAAGILAVCCFGVRAYVEMRIKLTQIQATSAEKIKANEKTVATATTNIATDQKDLTAIDQKHAQQDKEIKDQLASKPDSAQIQQMITSAVTGLKIQSTTASDGKKMISFEDTQENRDAINRTDAAFKSCRFDLDTCQQKQKQYLDIIGNQKTIIAAKQATIDTQASTIKELTRWGKGGNVWSRTGRVIVPATCGAAGAGLAAQGGVKPQGVMIAALASAATCALTIRF